ncbi:MAG: PP2C family protein-serine/threonine phosphatase [candidate division KSB1 bacterium]|nr:PP2C family protein-serine/threonine phosphatase [candidate division KSB1 bacterium]MDZ7369390.1 PP2C family protein-serine/threonine phosphatase [candidate division KSB1 bacterium]MDZ7407480.1 PP2C family protein-serine/threonine phosphatase [candidate division KSB1 bacterium]
MNLSHFTALIYLIGGIIIFLLGLLIFREDARQRLNRITAAMLFLVALGPILGAFGLLLEQVEPPASVDVDLLNRLFLVWEFFFPQLVLFSLVFPTEHPVLQKHPNLPFVLYIPQTLNLALALFLPRPEDVQTLSQWLGLNREWSLLLQPFKILFSLATAALDLMVRYRETYFAAINLAYVLTAIIVMYVGSHRLNNPRLITQVRWVLWGIRASMGLYAIAFLLPKLSPLALGREVEYTLTILSLLIGAGVIAWALIRYQFLDVRFIIRRGFVFSITSGLLVGIYMLGYTQAKNIVAAALGDSAAGGVPLVEILFLTVAVIIFQPLLSFLEEVVERIFFKGGQNYQQVLQNLSREIFGIVDPLALRNKITSTLQEAMLVESAHLILPKAAMALQQNAISPASQSVFFTTIRQAPRRDPKLNGNLAPAPDNAEIELRFEPNGQFIPLMAHMEAPVEEGDVLDKINLPVERQNLSHLRAQLFLPLLHREELVGVLTIGKKITQRRFSYEDMTLLSLLSTQIAIAFENTRVYQERLTKQRLDEELHLAREIQRLLLPRQMPNSEYFDIAAINVPSQEVGGDYYDFVDLRNGVIGVAIGDIAGKGIPGAMLMSNLQATGRAAAIRSTSTKQVMEELNNQITRSTTVEKYATFFYAILWPEKKITYTNAGHNYPLLCRNDGDICELRQSNLVVGVREGITYDEHTVPLQSGDVIIFYTDGITEAANANWEEFGIARLCEVVRQHRHGTAENLRNVIYRAVLQFAGAAAQSDDLTLVVVKVK